MPEDRKEEEEEQGQSQFEVSYSADKDARWLKKEKRCYLGYKALNLGFA